jgi:hypothetical protein
VAIFWRLSSRQYQRQHFVVSEHFLNDAYGVLFFNVPCLDFRAPNEAMVASDSTTCSHWLPKVPTLPKTLMLPEALTFPKAPTLSKAPTLPKAPTPPWAPSFGLNSAGLSLMMKAAASCFWLNSTTFF